MAALRILRRVFKHLLPSLMAMALLFAALAANPGSACGDGEFDEILQVSVLSADLPADPGDYDPPVVAINPIQARPARQADLPPALSAPAILAIYAPLPHPPWLGRTNSQRAA